VNGDVASQNYSSPFYLLLLPLIDEPAFKGFSANPSMYLFVRHYVSPADPTITDARTIASTSVTSYGVNAQVFLGIPRMPFTFQDGTSNTIAFAEHYAFDQIRFRFDILRYEADRIIRRPTFADEACGDVVPVTQGNPPGTEPSVPGLTFQVRPTREEVNPAIAQTPHRGGMIAALGDGSVRILAPQMSPSVYWAIVTPAGGEIISD
jgi:hypothetical protein